MDSSADSDVSMNKKSLTEKKNKAIVASGLKSYIQLYAEKRLGTTINLLMLMAAVVTIWTTQQASIQQLKAYVGIDSIQLEFQRNPNQPLAIAPGEWRPLKNNIIFKLKNFGATPAQDVQLKASWLPLSPPNLLPKNYKYPDLRESSDDEEEAGNADKKYTVVKGESKTVIFPGQQYPTRVGFFSASKFRSATEMKTLMAIYGHIDYKDIFYVSHQTRFCYLYFPDRPEGERFVPYEEHNEAD